MFDIWHKINEKGAVAIPLAATALTPLGWVEIGEVYPELMPNECRGCNVLDDSQLIKTAPFVVIGAEAKHYLFSAADPGKPAAVSLCHGIEAHAVAEDVVADADQMF